MRQVLEALEKEDEAVAYYYRAFEERDTSLWIPVTFGAEFVGLRLQNDPRLVELRRRMGLEP